MVICGGPDELFSPGLFSLKLDVEHASLPFLAPLALL